MHSELIEYKEIDLTTEYFLNSIEVFSDQITYILNLSVEMHETLRLVYSPLFDDMDIFGILKGEIYDQ